MCRKKGFTLIELLVVIAIIALLLAILMPSLQLVKRKAAAAVCLTNNKNLSLAWYMYQSENDGKLVGASMDKTLNGIRIGWIRKPRTEDGTEFEWWHNGEVTFDDEKRGVEEGSLFPYLKSVDVLHCPADNMRRNFFYPSDNKAFVSYTLTAALNGTRPRRISKFSHIRNPSSKYNFVEQAEERPYNSGGTFFLNISESSQTTWFQARGRWWTWRAPVAINHGDSSTFGFCDGHAEVRKWRDSHTIYRVKQRIIDGNGWYEPDNDRPADQVEDIGFMARGYPFPY